MDIALNLAFGVAGLTYFVVCGWILKDRIKAIHAQRKLAKCGIKESL